MSLDTQIEHAQSLIQNASRVTELVALREEHRVALASIEEELQSLLGGPSSNRGETVTRSRPTCSVCGQQGHTKRTCPNGGRDVGQTT